MDAGNLILHFKGDSSDLEKEVKKIDSSFGGLTKSMTIANLASTAISKGLSLITQNAGKAVSRIDTFNQFPKVLSNFGVSTDEANQSIKRIDKSVQGLPTSLDQAVSGVQDLFMVTKNLPEAEKLFKAVNDSAMVFANGSTEAVSRFTYAYKQAMASGKVSAQDFNQMNEAIPGVMDKVAESMGISFAELKDGLSNGSISMDQFNTALKKLDTEGVGSMASLESSAKSSTGGIATSIANAKTAVVRGVSEMIKSIDEGLKSAGLGGISDVVSSMGKVIENALKSVAPVIVNIVNHLSNLYNWFKKNKAIITGVVVVLGSMYVAFKLLTIINTIKTAIAGFKLAMTTLKITATLCGTSINTFSTALKLLNLGFLTSPIFWIIAGIVALVAGFVLLWNKCEGFRNFFINMWNGIVNIFNVVIDFVKNNWQTMLGFLINPFGTAFKLLYDNCEGFRNFIDGFVSAIKNFFVNLGTGIGNAVSKIVNWIKTLPSKIASIPGKIKNKFLSLVSDFKNIGKNMMTGLWNGVKGLKDWVINKVKNMGKSILKGLKNVLGIHSPSTEFAMIGKFSVLGYTEQLDKMKRDLQAQVEDTFSLSPSLTGTMNNSLSPKVYVNNNISMETDPLGQMVNKVKTFSGGAKNDYNYGMGV